MPSNLPQELLIRSINMQAADKRKQEQEELKSARIEHILECSLDLFSKGIEPITMNQIAENAEIGVASLYRYFSTKDDLAIECATFAWNKETEQFNKYFNKENFNQLSGFEQLSQLLGLFPILFKTEGRFFRFVYYFDAYIKRQNVSEERLTRYEATIIGPTKLVYDAIQKGRADETINTDGATDEELYLTLTHGLFSLAQKLSLSGEMLYMDRSIPAQSQMELLTKILLNSLRRNQ